MKRSVILGLTLALILASGCSGSTSTASNSEDTSTEEQTVETEAAETESSAKTKEEVEEKCPEIEESIKSALSDYDLKSVTVEATSVGRTCIYIHCAFENLEEGYQGFVEAALPASVYAANDLGIEVTEFIAYGELDDEKYVSWSTTDGNTGYFIDNRSDSTTGTFDLPISSITACLNGTYEPEEQEKEVPAIGMTESEVYNSTWGAPEKINKTETENSVREQWVYEDGYIYFVDGYVTSIQYR